MEAEHLAAIGRLDRIGKDGVAQRPADALAQPGDDATDDDHPNRTRRGENHSGGPRQCVTGGDDPLAMADTVAPETEKQFDRAGHSVSESLGQTKPERGEGERRHLRMTRAEDRQKAGHRRRRRLVAGVGQKACQTGADDVAIEPAGRGGCGLAHERTSRQRCRT